ncbi:hypothetical protein IR148_00590 [Dysgonomonas mossii]|uniref:Uncharacterized protein n=1 Tax=Dysgonomonas mossii TaxID=163665 RepID=A0A4Y9IS93_9BACT|nr:hypothetical protein [Dysgonomonas mossii]MBF0759539.1 hypothetical protein [Dysgonomonas mossii]TFU90505.1 hypothetical protein E4T88_00585 [Dysgonomonas mossii]
MLKLVSASVTKESTLTVGGYEYRVIYTIVNGVITSISCSIRQEVSSVLNEVGKISKENGQVNLFLRDTEDYIAHAEQFKAIVSEIEKELQPIEG